jgi:type IV fimbrial biogenesis protein FimT
MVISRTGGRRPAGFTLIELMVTVAVLVILTSVAAPSFSIMVANQRLKSGASDLFTALTRARSEAIKRNAEVTLAPLSSGQWQQGWRIANPGDASLTLEQHGALANTTISSGPASVVYLPNGRVKGSAAAAFSLSVSGSPQHRCVRVDLSGRPNLTSQEC